MEQNRRQGRHPGKTFARAKHVICNCPELRVNNVAEKCRRIDAAYTINKLRELVSDPVSSEQVLRISQLLCDYLREIGDEGYPLKHLPAVMSVLEFLAWKSGEVERYREHLGRMLKLCSRPPLLERASDNLVSSVIMEHYFTLLGYLLTILPEEEEIQQVRDALDCLLIEKTKPANIAMVKLNFRRQAMDNSKLPVIVVELLEAALPKAYPKILELAFMLASVSRQCCYRMLEAGVLNTLLIRMDLSYATQLRCTRPPDIELEGEEYPWDTMLLITSLLWRLVGSILSPGKLPENLPLLQQCAMWGLKYSFQRQILRGQYRAVNARIRNDIATLILAGIVALPSWELVSSGIAEDIVGLLSAIEPGTIKIWSQDVKFSNSNEDFFFKKTVLMIIAHLARIDVYVFVMRKAMIMPVILRIIKFCMNCKITERSSSSLILLEHATHILSLLAPRMATEFVKHKGTLTLLAVVDRVLNAKSDEHLVTILTRTTCSIVLQDEVLLLEEFRKHEMIPLLIRLTGDIAALDKLTMRRQRILTLLFIALEGLMKKQTSVQQMHGERSVQLIMEIFAKCLYQKKDDFQVDQRFLLAIGCYVWECVARCPASLQIFLQSGGLYSMLDIIEIVNYPVKCLYLGALTDIFDYTFCGPFLCTWRGANKKTGLMSLLAIIWREEEDRIGIKRCSDGSIGDPELPQMGTKQWADTYGSKLIADTSPTMVDMIGSVRSKIFSIVKIIERDGDRYEIANKHYKILLDALPTKDRITMCCVNVYLQLKLGQMWMEIAKYLEQAGITPLNVDAQLISSMVQWHHSWGIFIQENQRKLISAAKRVGEILEKEDYARIRDSKLAPTLDALDEVKFIRRTTDRSYMLKIKNLRKRQINAALRFPRDADVKRCHRTFAEKANFTVILGQHQSIDTSHLIGSGHDLVELPFVSPPDSPHEETYSSLGGASTASLSYERRLTGEC